MIKLSDLLFGYKKIVPSSMIWLGDKIDLAFMQFFPRGQMPVGDGGNWMFEIRGEQTNKLSVPCINCGEVMVSSFFGETGSIEQYYCFHCSEYLQVKPIIQETIH